MALNLGCPFLALVNQAKPSGRLLQSTSTVMAASGFSRSAVSQVVRSSAAGTISMHHYVQHCSYLSRARVHCQAALAAEKQRQNFNSESNCTLEADGANRGKKCFNANGCQSPAQLVGGVFRRDYTTNTSTRRDGFTSAAAAATVKEAASVVGNFDYDAFFQEEVARKKADNSYRIFKRVLRNADQYPTAMSYPLGVNPDSPNSADLAERVTIWCSNDYMGLSWHPKVKEAAMRAVIQHGVGSGGTRNISGNGPLHEQLEGELAALHGKEAGLLFSSCYVANQSTLYTMGTRLPGMEFVSDAGNHASMIDGIRTSQAPKHIYKHNDVESLHQRLQSIRSAEGGTSKPLVVAFETVHSMTGNVCPLEEIVSLCEEYNALSFVDEVHAVGLYGDHGAGVAERDGCMHRIDAITGTLGKAFANFGGYLVGNRHMVDAVRSYAAGFIFTTSLPPPTLCAAREAVRILSSAEGRELRALHQKRVAWLKTALQNEGIAVLPTRSHILPVHVGDPTLSELISNKLLNEHKMYVQHINYPTVARGEERLRIAPTPYHDEELSKQLVMAMKQIWKELNLHEKITPPPSHH